MIFGMYCVAKLLHRVLKTANDSLPKKYLNKICFAEWLEIIFIAKRARMGDRITKPKLTFTQPW